MDLSTVLERTDTGSQQIYHGASRLSRSERRVLIEIDGIADVATIVERLHDLSLRRVLVIVEKMANYDFVTETIVPPEHRTARPISPAMAKKFIESAPNVADDNDVFEVDEFGLGPTTLPMDSPATIFRQPDPPAPVDKATAGPSSAEAILSTLMTGRFTIEQLEASVPAEEADASARPNSDNEFAPTELLPSPPAELDTADKLLRGVGYDVVNAPSVSDLPSDFVTAAPGERDWAVKSQAIRGAPPVVKQPENPPATAVPIKPAVPILPAAEPIQEPQQQSRQSSSKMLVIGGILLLLTGVIVGWLLFR